MKQSVRETSAAPPFDVFEAMRKRRMHRAFTAESVSDAHLERLVYAAGRAPIARADIRHLVVVTDPALVHTLRQMCPGFVANAPAAIAVCTDLEKAEALVGKRGVALVAPLDSGAAAAYLILAAPALGLGVCIVTSWTESAVQAILGLPEHIRPEVLVAIGHPVASPPKAMRRFAPIIHTNRYGKPWKNA